VSAAPRATYRVAEYYSVEVPGILHARSGYAREARLEPLRFLRLALQGQQLLDGRCGQQLARRVCILGIVLPQPGRRSTLRVEGVIAIRARAQSALCMRTRGNRAGPAGARTISPKSTTFSPRIT
jgi:hypothetical protein